MIARPTTKRLMDVTSLPPKEAIGPNTSVLSLHKCEDGLSVHFVYHDSHGWYCSSHGRTCPAVEQARQHAKEK